MRLKEIREDRDLTQSDIAQVLNCCQSTYQQYEAGKRQLPITALKRLCEFYKLSADYILELPDLPYPKK